MSKIAFIFSQFPCYDETFILREMDELKAIPRLRPSTRSACSGLRSGLPSVAGLEFEIYSLKTPKDKIIHDEAKELAKSAYCLPFFSLNLLGKDLYFLFRHPGRYFVAFFQTLIFNLKSPNFFFKTGCLWYKAIGFAWIARKDKITHVHGQWATYPATVAFIISKLNNIPFSFTGHAHDIYLDTTMLAFKMRRAKFVLTCTADNKKHLLRILNANNRESISAYSRLISENSRLKLEDKIIINYHGVDLEKFKNEDRRWKIEDGKFKILSVGSLLPCKGFEYLIEACNILKEKGIEFECTIAGGGKLEEKLKLQVTGCNLQDDVKLTGYITQDKLIPIYQQADIFVLVMVPEIHWGIPNVLLEAMAAGVPVICTMLPSILELIKDGETGFIIPSEDPAAIAVILEKLYRESELRKKVGQAGRRVVEEKFDVVKNAAMLRELFEG